MLLSRDLWLPGGRRDDVPYSEVRWETLETRQLFETLVAIQSVHIRKLFRDSNPPSQAET